MDFSDLGIIDLSNLMSIEVWRTIFAPFVLVLIILWAVLDRMKLFGKKTNIIISLSLALMLATTQSFVLMSNYITEMSGSVMLSLFVILLVGGTLMWVLDRTRDVYYEQTPSPKRLAMYTKNYHKSLEKAENADNPAKKAAHMKEAEHWKHQMELEKIKIRI